MKVNNNRRFFISGTSFFGLSLTSATLSNCTQGRILFTRPFSLVFWALPNQHAFQFLYRFLFPSAHCGLAYAQFVGDFLLRCQLDSLLPL